MLDTAPDMAKDNTKKGVSQIPFFNKRTQKSTTYIFYTTVNPLYLPILLFRFKKKVNYNPNIFFQLSL